MSSVYQLKVALQDTKPPIWRRVLVAGDSTLGELHDVLQAAFGWQDSHLHEFEIDGVRYGMADLEDLEDPPLDEHGARLVDVAAEGARFAYVYDFGDYWQHRVTVEKVTDSREQPRVPALLGGKRACPPEDCGGTGGYVEFLEAIADPDHEEHDSILEWVGGEFDPEAVDAAGFDKRLKLQTAPR